jgi:PAS domain S-box-containing protein
MNMAAKKTRVLIVDDDARFRESLASVLGVHGYEIVTASEGESALRLARDNPPSVAVIDLKLQDISGLEVLRRLKQISPDTECIVLTGHASQDSAIEAVNLGAYSYIQKPYDLDGLLLAIRRASEKSETVRALRESEQKYRVLVEQSLQGMVVAEGLPPRLVFANRALGEMVGYGVGELLSLSPEEVTALVHPEDRPFFFQRYRDRVQGRAAPSHYEFRAIRKDGAQRWLEMHASRIEYEGAPAVQAVFIDISDRKQAESELRESYQTVRDTLMRTVNALATAVDKRDPYTAGHQRRVADLAVAIAEEMGVPREQIDGIHIAGLIHDIGKIYIPAEILSKPSRVSEIEMLMIQTHPQAGYDVLSTVDFPWPVAETVLEHHERMNGSGYPRGLLGADMLLEARILSVADVVEAMTSHRPYRPAHSAQKALEEILQHRDSLYDPDVVDAVVEILTHDGYTSGGS